MILTKTTICKLWVMKGSKMVMKKVWDLCKVLENAHRMTLLSEIYKSMEGGGNVG